MWGWGLSPPSPPPGLSPSTGFYGPVYSGPWHNGTFLYFGEGKFRTL